MFEIIEPWRTASECYAEPSLDFLYRACRAGMKIHFNSKFGVLTCQSGSRRGVYLHSENEENRHYANRIASAQRFSEQILLQAALDSIGHATAPTIHFNLRRALRKLVYRPLQALHINPSSVRYFCKFRCKGTVIAPFWQFRRLPAIRRDGIKKHPGS